LLAGIEQVILKSTLSKPPREMVSYLLTDVLDASGAHIPAFSSVDAQDAGGASHLLSVADFDIRKAYVVVERIDEPTAPYNTPQPI
jgi:hypothetical protein